jgi:cytochrome c oxidase subunit II
MPHIQSVIHPAGIGAAHVSHLWWVMFAICAIVWIAIAAAAAIAIGRGYRGESRATDSELGRNVTIAAAISIVALVALLTESVVTGRAINTLRTDGALHVKVTANQWWWDVFYENPDPSLTVTTANEIHIPVGRPVAFDLFSSDVIHSLWIPNLQGKIDLVPGRENQLWLLADRPGVYRGQCAEYCGLQHAKMAFVVVAEPEQQFQAWIVANRASAPEPSTDQQKRGKEVVERGPCAMCHAIAGTLAGGRTAPDLTHIASRSTIGAGAVPNTPGYLGGWIADPQHIKPGNRMPTPGLNAEQLQAVIAYLETLK